MQFPLAFDEYFGRLSGLGSGVFVPIGVESKCGIVTFVVFIPIGVESKGSRLVETFWRSNS